MTKETMTSRERVQCVLNGQKPDRLPFNFWMDRDQMDIYDKKWGSDFRITHYGADVVEAFVSLPFWYEIPVKSHYDGKTHWQMEPLVDDIKDALCLAMPDPNDPNVYIDIQNKKNMYPDKAIFALMLAPIGILEPLRLAENLFLELYDSPDEIHALLKKIEKVLVEAAHNACSMDIDVLYIAADICGRDGALVSPNHLKEFNFNYVKKLVEIAHNAGKKVFYHSDGLILPTLDIYVEYGIDGCNPLEPRYNNAQEFAEKFSGKLMLYGAGDNCNIIPNGTQDQVAEHVRSQFNILGKNGGYIFSTHDIPSSCPQENIDVMVDTIKNCTY